jgi:uncharacterized membrane protein
MRIFRLTLLGLLIFLTGIFAGQMLNEIMDAREALQSTDDHIYVVYIQSVNKLLQGYIQPMSGIILVVFVISLAVFYNHWKKWPYALMMVSFVCFIADALITFRFQLPLNDRIQSLNPNHLPIDVDQIKADSIFKIMTMAILRSGGFIMIIIVAFKMIKYIHFARYKPYH